MVARETASFLQEDVQQLQKYIMHISHNTFFSGFWSIMRDKERHPFQKHVHLHIFTLSHAAQSHTSTNAWAIALIADEPRLT